MFRCEKVRQTSLPAARSEEEYRLHQAALEWSLTECIVLQSADDIQSRGIWRDRLEPFEHQVQNLFTFCRRLPVSLLADDVGLGKTISAGLILSELMVRRRVSRALVLCPKILCPQWREELDSKFGIESRIAFGADLDRQFKSGAPVIITTYDSAKDRLDALSSGAFDLLILDEAHKLRNLCGGGEPPRMATAVHDALHKRLFRFVVMLTATPIQNRLWDLYSLLECLTAASGHRNPLGTPDEFRRTFLASGSAGRQLNPAAAETFRNILRQYVVRTRRGDARLQFPTREVQILPIDLTAPEKQLVTLVAERIAHLPALMQVSLAQALMSSPAALAAQLETMAQQPKSTLKDAAIQARALADSCPEPAKLHRLLTLCDELKASRPDWRLVVFTHRKETQQIIGAGLARRGMPFGFIQGGKANDNQRAIEAFRREPPDVRVLVSTDAGAEGINLQVANVLVNYDLPWNPMVVEQRIGRLQRLNSRHATVVICNLVAAESAEANVVARLLSKLQGIAQALGDIESILETTGWDDEKDSFETKIRELVVRSLLGQNVDEGARLAQESIERARQEIADRDTEIEQTLGNLTELHHQGPALPKLRRTAPSLEVREFVLQALAAEGATIREVGDMFEVKMPGKRAAESIAFDESATEGIAGKVKVYQPGKGDFERLVQTWVARSGQIVSDRRSKTTTEIEALARTWCATIATAEFLGFEIVRKESRFQGHGHIKVKASNGVDGYEKLLDHAIHPAGHPIVEPGDGMATEVRLDSVETNGTDLVVRAVEADPDVSEFCRFYSGRLIEELARIGDDPRRRIKLRSYFAPTVSAEVVGLRGSCYDEVWLRVRFRVEGGDYDVTLRAVPVVGAVVEQPERQPCGATGVLVPVDCLESCEVTGSLVLRHLLTTSEATGRRGLRSRLVTCPTTGKKAFDDELATSAISGTIGIRELFVNCQETGDTILSTEAGETAMGQRVVRADLLAPSDKPPHRLGVASDFNICAVTGRMLLTDELGTSAHSGKVVDRELLVPSRASGRLALADELQCCAVSGDPVLPDELGACAVTGQRVRQSLLVVCEPTGETVLATETGRSDVSKKTARRSLLRRSERPPGRLGLADEMARCEVGGKNLLLDELARSAVSEKLVDRSLLVRSALSGKFALPDEVVQCSWTEQPLLRTESGRCTLTGELVASTLLNSEGQLIDLRRLLDGDLSMAQTADQMIPDLRHRDPATFRNVRHVWVARSPRGGNLAVCCEVPRWWGMQVRYVGFLFQGRSYHHFMGRGTSGYRGARGWVFEQQVTFAEPPQ